MHKISGNRDEAGKVKFNLRCFSERAPFFLEQQSQPTRTRPSALYLTAFLAFLNRVASVIIPVNWPFFISNFEHRYLEWQNDVFCQLI